MKESVVETYLRKRCNENGFLCYKFTSPAHPGVPDRVIMGHGVVLFVETKAPGKKPRPLQVEVITEMRNHGVIVYVIDTKERVDKFMSVLLNALDITPDESVKKSQRTKECKQMVGAFKIVKKTLDLFEL